MWECQNATSVFLFVILSDECDNPLLYSDGALKYCFTKAGFCFTVFVNWQFNEVFTYLQFLLLPWECIFTVHRTHTGSLPLLSISKLLLHLFRCSTRSCFWLNAAGIVQQRVLPSPFRTAPPGSKEWITFFFFLVFLFLETRPRLGLLLRAKVQGTADRCTITRRSQCLTPHHLETVARSLTWESNRSWSSM